MSERTKEKIILYQIYFSHYEDDILVNLKRAVEAAKEYVKKFSKDEEDREIIEYFKTVIPELEKFIVAIEKAGCK